MIQLVPYTVVVRYGTMCNLRNVDKVADKAAVSIDSKSFFGGVFMQHSLKRKSTLK